MSRKKREEYYGREERSITEERRKEGRHDRVGEITEEKKEGEVG